MVTARGHEAEHIWQATVDSFVNGIWVARPCARRRPVSARSPTSTPHRGVPLVPMGEGLPATLARLAYTVSCGLPHQFLAARWEVPVVAEQVTVALLGAGSSVPAGVPAAQQILEVMLSQDGLVPADHAPRPASYPLHVDGLGCRKWSETIGA